MPPPPPEFDTSRVSPQDAVVTLRSLPRRFAAAFDHADDPGEVTRRPASGGLSPLEHAAATASAVEVVGTALRRVMLTDNPRVELPSATGPGSGGPGTGEASAVLSHLGAVAASVADNMSDIHGDSWSRPAQSGSGTTSALAIARLAVRIGVEHLRAAERALGGDADSE